DLVHLLRAASRRPICATGLDWRLRLLLRVHLGDCRLDRRVNEAKRVVRERLVAHAVVGAGPVRAERGALEQLEIADVPFGTVVLLGRGRLVEVGVLVRRLCCRLLVPVRGAHFWPRWSSSVRSSRVATGASNDSIRRDWRSTAASARSMRLRIS